MESITGTEEAVGTAVTGIARLIPAQVSGPEFEPRSGVFEEIFLVFLVLGTIVGIIVITYSLYNAYKYRDDGGRTKEETERPAVGELPGGGGGGRKLFVSFGISAIIVVSLIAWTYGALLYVEAGPQENVEDGVDIEIVASQFQWEFRYENGHVERNTMYIPVDQLISIEVTSRDVWHTFGAPDLRIKADAIPGQTETTWFAAEETGTYQAWCFELCGAGHSTMHAEVVVMEQDEFEDWYEDVGAEANDSADGKADDADESADEQDGETTASIEPIA